MRLLTELLLFIGVSSPPSLAIARFTGVHVPRFFGTDVVLGLSTVALLAAFILATYIQSPKARRPRRQARPRHQRVLLPAAEAFTTLPRARSRRSLGSDRPLRPFLPPTTQN